MVNASIRDRQSNPVSLAASEVTFRRLVEEAHDMLTVWALDGTLTYISPSFQELFGHDPADWIGKPFAPLVHPEDLGICLAANQQVAETGEKLAGVEFRHQHVKGHWCWSAISISPVKDDSGTVVGFQGIVRDVSDRKQQETALQFIVEGTVGKTGSAFFQACVQHLAEICQAQYAFVTQLVDETCQRSRMLSLWTGTGFVEPYEFDLIGTPCQMVFRDNWGIFCDGIQTRFPQADALATLGAESYLVVVIRDSHGKAIGNLGIIDTKPLATNLNTAKYILQLLAARVGAEMERYAAETALHERMERQTLLNQIAQQIRNSLDLDTVIATTVAAIRDLLELDICAFAWYDPTVEAASWIVEQESRLDGVISFLGQYPATLVGEVTPILLDQSIHCIDNAVEYAEPIHRAFLRQIQCQSEMLIPIQTRANRIGVIICCHNRQVHPWTVDEVELLEAVRYQLAIAIEQAALYAESRAKSRDLQQSFQDLKQTQAQMLQTEKMSSLGQLVAGIAHEINNPVNFIHGNLAPLRDYAEDMMELLLLYQQMYPESGGAIAEKIATMDLSFIQTDLPNLFTSMKVGTERIRAITTSLRSFSRLDEAEFKLVDLHEGIDSALMILQNRLNATQRRREIQVTRQYGQLPEVECFAGHLNQVFMNILLNAIDALEERDQARSLEQQAQQPSTIYITTDYITTDHSTTDHSTTDHSNPQVTIRIADNGPGIPVAIQPQIFDPFFTTKPVGKGTGMGMSISYQIVTEKHGGSLSCQSIPGQGAEFTIQLPVRQC